MRIIEIETSQFDPDPNKKWSFGSDGYVVDVCVEYPNEMDTLLDYELLELADDEDEDVHYVDLPPSVSGEESR